MAGYWEYWRACERRYWSDTWEFTKRYWIIEVIATLVGGIGAAISMIMFGENEISSILVGVIGSLVAFSLLIAGTTLVNAFRAPYLLWSEERVFRDESGSKQNYDPDLAQQLKDLYDDGNHIVEFSDQMDPMQGATDWADQVHAILEKELPGEAFGFKSRGDVRGKFPVKLEKLRLIILRYEERQA